MHISKPHPNIQIRTTVTVNLSAEQWALRTDDFPRVVIEKVADYINKRVTFEFNKGESAEMLRGGYDSLKQSFEIYVTPETDTVFERVSNTIYNGE